MENIVINCPRLADMPDVLTAEQTAKLLAVSKNTLYKLVREGKIHTLRMCGRMIRISKGEIQSFISNSGTE